MFKLGLVEKFIIGVVVVLAVLGAYKAWELRQRNLGAEAERHAVEKENRNAYSQARDSRDKYLSCIDSGGVYHFDTEDCERG